MDDYNILLVRKDAKKGEYSTIEDAIAAINTAGDASSSNRYLIKVGVGAFEENLLNVPSWVTILGESNQSTEIKTAGDHDCFILNTQTHIFNLRINMLARPTRKAIYVLDSQTGIVTGKLYVFEYLK